MSAVCAFHVIEAFVESRKNLSARAPVYKFNGTHALHIGADPYAAAALYAFVGIPYYGRGRAVYCVVVFSRFFEAQFLYTEVIRQLSEFAVLVFVAGETVLRVICEKKFCYHSAGFSYPRVVCYDGHALFRGDGAGRF